MWDRNVAAALVGPDSQQGRAILTVASGRSGPAALKNTRAFI
jgi:hypothetical protein